MRKKLIILTLLPLTITLITAGIVGMHSVSNTVTSLAASGQSAASELVCSQVNYEIKSFQNLVTQRAESITLNDFLVTVTDRDNIDSNEYYSYAIGELDSAVSEYRSIINDGFIASFDKPDIIFSNSASGWSGAADFNIKNMPYYQPLYKGRKTVCVTDPYENPADGKTVITVAGAVKSPNSGEVIGAIGVNIDIRSIGQIVSDTSAKSSNTVLITGNDDIIIYSTDTEDVMNTVSAMRLTVGETIGSLYTFKLKDRKMIGSYSGIDGTDWNVYVLSPYSTITDLVQHNAGQTVIIYAAMLLVIILIMTIMAGVLSAPISDYTEKIRKINFNIEPDKELEADSLFEPKGYYEIELLGKSFNDLLKRNSEMVKQLREMNLKSERERRLYQTALESSSDVVFEYDIQTDMLITYGSFFDESVPKTQQIRLSGFLNKLSSSADNNAVVKQKAAMFFSGQYDEPVQICQSYIKHREKKSVWVVFEGTAVSDGGVPVKIIGKVRNINDVMLLKNEAETDALTGFLNKISTENHITSYISSRPADGDGTVQAMALIDIDNFKSVNDKLGHHVGDEALKEVSSKLRSIFRSGDILGRIGGDEFMVFMTNVPDIEAVRSICSRINKSIKKDYPCKDGCITISCSIGVALYPVHGESFAELYSNADIAMYVTKSGGKNGFTIFDGQERVEYKSQRID